MSNLLKDRTLLITGGTGSFGKAVLDRFLNAGLKEIRVFSRDEKKQNDMRGHYNSALVKFYLGDVRDYQSLCSALRDVNFVFHAAALKQVPSCEFYPLEAVKTNVLGTENVLDACELNGIEKVVCLSTDKAVYPVNAMGISKSLMEKIAIAKSRSSTMQITVTRYGNVMASRGSVIPLFKKQILDKVPITVTDENMTRFLMSLDDAVDLVMFAFLNGKSGEVFVQKSPAASIKTLAAAVKNVMGCKNHPIKTIGTRHGEKLHETLLSREEMFSAHDLGEYFCVKPDARVLHYEKFYVKGEASISEAEDYNSHNARQLNVEELTNLISQLSLFKKNI